MSTMRNDDELEMNWTAEVVGGSNDEDAISAGSEDEFEEEAELELAPNVKRSRDTETADVEMEEDAVKKQKTDPTVHFYIAVSCNKTVEKRRQSIRTERQSCGWV